MATRSARSRTSTSTGRPASRSGRPSRRRWSAAMSFGPLAEAGLDSGAIAVAYDKAKVKAVSRC